MATPEEAIRQRLIQRMISDWGYPLGLLSVEKELKSFSSLVEERRSDLLCYRPGEGGLIPLLLVECKAGPIEGSAENQAFGYNTWIKAPFICLCNETSIKTLWVEKGRLTSVPFLPLFSELMKYACP